MSIKEKTKLAAGPPLCHGPYKVPRSSDGHKQQVEIYTPPLTAVTMNWLVSVSEPLGARQVLLGSSELCDKMTE